MSRRDVRWERREKGEKREEDGTLPVGNIGLAVTLALALVDR